MLDAATKLSLASLDAASLGLHVPGSIGERTAVCVPAQLGLLYDCSFLDRSARSSCPAAGAVKAEPKSEENGGPGEFNSHARLSSTSTKCTACTCTRLAWLASGL